MREIAVGGVLQAFEDAGLRRMHRHRRIGGDGQRVIPHIAVQFRLGHDAVDEAHPLGLLGRELAGCIEDLLGEGRPDHVDQPTDAVVVVTQAELRRRHREARIVGADADVAAERRRHPAADAVSADILKIETKNYDYRYLCTELRGKIMIPVISRVRSQTMEEFGELIRHAGEEFVYVLEGAIEVHSEFYDPITLHAGEYIYLDSEMGHGYLVTGGFEEATVLAVCASAAANLQQELISHARAAVPTSDKGAKVAKPDKPKTSTPPKKVAAKSKRRASAA